MTLSEHAQRIQRIFDTVASGYDHPAASWFDEAASELVAKASLTAQERAIDVATGTGKVALRLAAATPKASVTAVDLSEGMLAEAERKAKAAGIHNISFVQSAFDQLPFGETFDVLTCSFGIFFAEDMATTLMHWAKQTRPTGRVLLTTFGEGSFSPCIELFRRAYEDLGYELPPPRWLSVSTPEQVTDLAHTAGLEVTARSRHDYGFELQHADAWWQIVWNAGFRGLVEAMPDEHHKAFKHRHLAEVEDAIANDRGRLAVNVWVTELRHPSDAAGGASG